MAFRNLKKKKDKPIYATNNVNSNIKIDFKNELLYLPKIKDGIKIHRKFDGRIVSAIVSKNSSVEHALADNRTQQ
jgi:putative transposase